MNPPGSAKASLAMWFTFSLHPVLFSSLSRVLPPGPRPNMSLHAHLCLTVCFLETQPMTRYKGQMDVFKLEHLERHFRHLFSPCSDSIVWGSGL